MPEALPSSGRKRTSKTSSKTPPKAAAQLPWTRQELLARTAATHAQAFAAGAYGPAISALSLYSKICGYDAPIKTEAVAQPTLIRAGQGPEPDEALAPKS